MIVAAISDAGYISLGIVTLVVIASFILISASHEKHDDWLD